ncbi:MAG: hypothetical protein K5867_06485 [Bacteroidales bacterium]|nr:hypothetical protein [Bacteroidales bacterium]
MRKAILILVVLCGICLGASAQSVGDSVMISGRLVLDFEGVDEPMPLEQEDVFIADHRADHLYFLDVLGKTKTDRDGFFSFKMPKGKYIVWLFGHMVFKDYYIIMDMGTTHREIDAQTNVRLGDWKPAVEECIQIPFYPDGEVQKMKVDGVKVTVR